MITYTIDKKTKKLTITGEIKNNCITIVGAGDCIFLAVIKDSTIIIAFSGKLYIQNIAENVRIIVNSNQHVEIICDHDDYKNTPQLNNCSVLTHGLFKYNPKQAVSVEKYEQSVLYKLTLPIDLKSKFAKILENYLTGVKWLNVNEDKGVYNVSFNILKEATETDLIKIKELSKALKEAGLIQNSIEESKKHSIKFSIEKHTVSSILALDLLGATGITNAEKLAEILPKKLHFICDERIIFVAYDSYKKMYHITTHPDSFGSNFNIRTKLESLLENRAYILTESEIYNNNTLDFGISYEIGNQLLSDLMACHSQDESEVTGINYSDYRSFSG